MWSEKLHKDMPNWQWHVEQKYIMIHPAPFPSPSPLPLLSQVEEEEEKRQWLLFPDGFASWCYVLGWLVMDRKLKNAEYWCIKKCAFLSSTKMQNRDIR